MSGRRSTAAQSGRPSEAIVGGRTIKAWNALNPGRRRVLRARAFAAAFPLAVRALNGAGLGPLSAELSTAELRRSGLRAMSEVVERLQIGARHVIFGHTHRTGMLADDVEAEWLTPGGTRLHNCGSWVFSETFARDPASPYWPGGAVILEDAAAPRLVRLLPHREAVELAPPPLSAPAAQA